MKTLLNECNCGRKVPDQTTLRCVLDVDDFVLHHVWEERLDPVGYLQDVGNTVLLERFNVRSCLDVAQKKFIKDLVHALARIHSAIINYYNHS